jgi:hypothetical protein
MLDEVRILAEGAARESVVRYVLMDWEERMRTGLVWYPGMDARPWGAALTPSGKRICESGI